MIYLQLAAGACLLYLGAGWLVAGASGLALALRVSGLIVGLTVVAYGTSAPESVVAVQAALAGHGGLALGNVVGANIANLGLILGFTCLLRPAQVSGALRGRELPLLLATALVLAWVLADGRLGRLEGLGLLASALAYTIWAVATARSKGKIAAAEAEVKIEGEAAEHLGAPGGRGAGRHALVGALGLGILLLGGALFVAGAKALALRWGLSERLVGLTVVTLGTTLPELSTSLVAAARGRADIALGNVVGSNIFNVLFVLGLAGLARPIGFDAADLRPDLGVLLGITVLAMIFLRTERILQRWEGGLLLAAYLAYLSWLVLG